MSRLTRRPIEQSSNDISGRYEKFNLAENPFPSDPFVNQESKDKRINGNLYEVEIRRTEFNQIVANFLNSPQANPNHLRLGYIMDTSYIGRGNGKSAFLVNLQQDINRDFCLDISDGQNKCFAIYVTPEPGGRTKTFPSFVDLIYDAILRFGIIETSLAVLRLEAIESLYPEKRYHERFSADDEIVNSLSSIQWYKDNGIDYSIVAKEMFNNFHLQQLPIDFPLHREKSWLSEQVMTRVDFERYYITLKKGKERIDFVFSHLVQLFQAAGFNGAYILVDDFERIPNFQSARQRTDFALELRSCLFDGLTVNARTGFYNIILVLHAGVPRLIADAWEESGMANRSPIEQAAISHHVIPFEKLNKRHAVMLLRKYLSEYRISSTDASDLTPFTEHAAERIGELSEYNAAKILKKAYLLLEMASLSDGGCVINEEYVNSATSELESGVDKSIPDIGDTSSVDLMRKSREEI